MAFSLLVESLNVALARRRKRAGARAAEAPDRGHAVGEARAS